MTSSTLHADAYDFVAPDASSRDGRHDFDFLHGRWRMRHRRLREPLTGSSEWYEFEGTVVERPLWDGQANIEEVDAMLPDGVRLRGLALRLYDPIAHHWTIHWSSSVTGRLDPPMTGAFRDGRGVFYGRDEYRGQPIMLRFLWTMTAPDAPRWEQAFSVDEGVHWETNWVMDFTRENPELSDDACHPEQSERVPASPGAASPVLSNVIELRQYTLRPGQRDTLIDIFDREFVEGQERTGMQVVAQFRDLDRPDVFTWMRGFSNMTARGEALAEFYDGPVWARHRDAANATMLSWDNVRLLRPAQPDSGFRLASHVDRATTATPSELIVATIYTLRDEVASSFPSFFERTIAPCLAIAGGAPIAMFETEPAANSFPRLPIREGEQAFVWFARFESVPAHAAHLTALAASASWSDELRPLLDEQLAAPAEVWRLVPTARSRELR